MNTIKFKTSAQTKQVLKDLSRQPHQVKTALKKAGYDFGMLVTKDVRNDMTYGVKTGRRYLINIGRGGRQLKRARWHRASATGESPAVITGNLRASVDFRVKGYRRLEIGAGNSKVNYAEQLEVEMRRFYLKNGIKRNMKAGQSLIAKRLSSVLK
jgi:hypothetical protein